MATIQAQFGSIVRRRRLELGIGQEPFADKAGLHRTHISLLERGLRMPSLLVIKKAAAALETTMAALMGELEGASVEQEVDPDSRTSEGHPKKAAGAPQQARQSHRRGRPAN